MNASSIFGRLLPSFLADTLGPFNTYLPACAATGALLLALLGITSTGALVVFGVLYGFCSGAGASLCLRFLSSALTWSRADSDRAHRAADRDPHREPRRNRVSTPLPRLSSSFSETDADALSTRMGATFFVMSFGSLLGTPISGALLGASDSARWWRPIVFSAVLVLVGSAVVGGARGAVARRKGTWRV